MRNFYFMASSIFVFTIFSCNSSSTPKNKEADLINPVTDKMAVLELFTSQGCSSCPPADKIIGTYTSSKNIIPLSFHVDYWDRAGWKDPYSSKKYSQRQYKYASILHSNVYTPQLIINGTDEMVGSNAHKISSTLKKIFSEHAEVTLAIKKADTANGKINISFDIMDKPVNSILNVALVERKTVTPVKAGENSGATLTDYNVVRDFKTIDTFKNGENNLTQNISPLFELKNMSLILFLQKKDNNQIIAADKIDL